MKVNILGTDYFLEEKTASEEPFLEDGDGFCDFTSKRIVVRKYTDSERRMNSNDIPEVARQAVVRHELTHAFLYESGMECFDDEIIVEWVARLFPKLFCAFVDAGAVTVALDGATVVTGGLNAGQVNNLPGKIQNSKQDEFWRAGEDPTFMASLCDYIKTACKLQHGEALIEDKSLTELIRQELLCFVGVLEGDYNRISSVWNWKDAASSLAARSYNSKRAGNAIKSVLDKMEPAKPASRPGEMPFFPESFEISENLRQKLFPSGGYGLSSEDVAAALKVMGSATCNHAFPGFNCPSCGKYNLMRDEPTCPVCGKHISWRHVGDGVEPYLEKSDEPEISEYHLCPGCKRQTLKLPEKMCHLCGAAILWKKNELLKVFPVLARDWEKPEKSEVQDPAPNLDPLNELAATVSMAMCQLESAKVLLHSCEWDSAVIAHDIECALTHASDTTHFLKYKIDKEVSKRD